MHSLSSTAVIASLVVPVGSTSLARSSNSVAHVVVLNEEAINFETSPFFALEIEVRDPDGASVRAIASIAMADANDLLDFARVSVGQTLRAAGIPSTGATVTSSCKAPNTRRAAWTARFRMGSRAIALRIDL